MKFTETLLFCAERIVVGWFGAIPKIVEVYSQYDPIFSTLFLCAASISSVDAAPIFKQKMFQNERPEEGGVKIPNYIPVNIAHPEVIVPDPHRPYDIPSHREQKTVSPTKAPIHSSTTATSSNSSEAFVKICGYVQRAVAYFAAHDLNNPDQSGYLFFANRANPALTMWDIESIPGLTTIAHGCKSTHHDNITLSITDVCDGVIQLSHKLSELGVPGLLRNHLFNTTAIGFAGLDVHQHHSHTIHTLDFTADLNNADAECYFNRPLAGKVSDFG